MNRQSWMVRYDQARPLSYSEYLNLARHSLRFQEQEQVCLVLSRTYILLALVVGLVGTWLLSFGR
jgi:hypothetical protein